VAGEANAKINPDRRRLANAAGMLSGALAGPWEDGMASYNRGDYMPAIRLFRPLAEKGNPKAQSVIGVMYRKGEGVARNPLRAFMWFSMAAARGDAKAKAELHEVSRGYDAGGDIAGAGDDADLRSLELPAM
jgi:TPR repeat protein